MLTRLTTTTPRTRQRASPRHSLLRICVSRRDPWFLISRAHAYRSMPAASPKPTQPTRKSQHLSRAVVRHRKEVRQRAPPECLFEADGTAVSRYPESDCEGGLELTSTTGTLKRSSGSYPATDPPFPNDVRSGRTSARRPRAPRERAPQATEPGRTSRPAGRDGIAVSAAYFGPSGSLISAEVDR